MLRLVVVLFIALCLSAHANDDLWVTLQGNGVYTTAQEQEANSKINRIAKDLQRDYYRELSRKANVSLRAMMKVGVINLRNRGHQEEAGWLERGWKRWDGEIERIVLSGRHRDIGSWKPLSTWLAAAYEVIEYALTYNVAYALRLTDIKSLNYGLVVTFSPCEYGLDEFMKHTWTGDPKYRSVVPLVTYWTVAIGCSFSSFGITYFYVCGPFGMLCELAMNKAISPWLGPRVYNLFCE